jgi:hypothetical protein
MVATRNNSWSKLQKTFIGSGENVTADVKQLANAFRTAKWI